MGADEPTIDTIVTELREAYEAATGGEWHRANSTSRYLQAEHQDQGMYLGQVFGPQADAELIVKAHNYLPRLAIHIEQQRNVIQVLQDAVASYGKELAELRERLSRFEAVDPWRFSNECPGCGLDVLMHRKGYKHAENCLWAGVGE